MLQSYRQVHDQLYCLAYIITYASGSCNMSTYASANAFSGPASAQTGHGPSQRFSGCGSGFWSLSQGAERDKQTNKTNKQTNKKQTDRRGRGRWGRRQDAQLDRCCFQMEVQILSLFVCLFVCLFVSPLSTLCAKLYINEQTHEPTNTDFTSLNLPRLTLQTT